VAKDLNEDHDAKVYQLILGLMEDLKADPYHWGRFTDARKRWAREARYVSNSLRLQFSSSPILFAMLWLTKYIQEYPRRLANRDRHNVARVGLMFVGF
jgi:hypothetical protein